MSGTMLVLQADFPTKGLNIEQLKKNFKELVSSFSHEARRRYALTEFTFEEGVFLEGEPGKCFLKFDVPRSENAFKLQKQLGDLWIEIAWPDRQKANSLGRTCPACQGATANNSDAFFRSFDVSYRCKCGCTVNTNGKGIDRLLGLNVMHTGCDVTAYIPPTVWCQTCGQNLVVNWQSLIVLDDGGEAANKVSRAVWESEAQRPQAFRAPQNAQHLKPPLIDCKCDNCGGNEWWTPDGHHALSPGDMVEDQIPLRCFACGRWAILNI